MWSFRVVVGCLVVCLLAVFQLQAQNATCTNWQTFVLNPADLNNPSEESDGVNDNHTVVGRAFYNFNKPNFKGFVHYSNGKITYWLPSNAKYSWLTDRNILGNTVGGYVDTLGILHAAYLHGSTTSLIVHPKAVYHSTRVVGINNLNTLLGTYSDINHNQHIFKRRSDGSFLAVPNFPGAVETDPSAFNDNGVVVGGYTNPGDCCGIVHGFIYRNGSFAPLNYRKTVNTNTEVYGISNNGVIVGDHYGNGFLYANGVFKDIVGPNGQQVTVRNISAGGIITGDTSVPGSVGPHGFTATCQ
jgi:hypothetical protein